LKVKLIAMTIKIQFQAALSVIAILGASAFLQSCQYDVEDPCSERTAVYNSSVAIVLDAHCSSCHGGTFPEAGVGLDNFESAADATLSGDVIYRIGLPANDPLAMPPNGSFGDCDVALLEKWASLGAPESE
jgi:cytochrome c5